MTETNMLYLESPIGVGFSYSNSSSDYQYYNDAMTGILFSIFLLDCCNEIYPLKLRLIMASVVSGQY